MMTNAQIPMKAVGPIKIRGPEIEADVTVPLATYEIPLWPSTARGARVSMLTSGIHAVIISECMTRSIILGAPTAILAAQLAQAIKDSQEELAAVVTGSSRFAQLKDIQTQQIANLIYVRFSLTTGDASGHNMVTKAADALLTHCLTKYPSLEYVSISGNYCTDKKVSAVNGILGRGKSVVADILIPKDVCEKQLKTTPEKIVELNIKKNLIGSILAGSLRSANAHYANILLALYLATGQDAANIVEGSQGMTYAEVRGDDLYFCVNLPHIIVGTVGNGKELDFVKENLKTLGCLENAAPGKNARRLALITAATVLCGELSLLAAQTNQNELMRSHLLIERQQSKRD